MKKSFLKRSFLILFQQNRTSLYLAVFFAFISSFACQGMNEPREKRKRSDDSSSSLHQSKKRRKQSKKAIYRPKESFDRKKSEPHHTFFIYPGERFQRPKYLRNEQIKIVPMSDEHRFYPIDTFDIPEESLPSLTQIPTPTPVPEFLAHLKKALDQNDIFTITESFDQLLQKIPAYLKTQENRNEGFYHSLAHTILRFTGNQVSSDFPTGSGEADTLVQTKDARKLYLFEFKHNHAKKSEGQQTVILNALKQIFNNDYYKEHHQDGIPITLAGISFYDSSNPKMIIDSFQEVACGALCLKTAPKTLRAYPFAQPRELIGDHNEAPNHCTPDNWDKFHVQKSASMDDPEESIDQPYSQINTYHQNLKNIHLGLKDHDVPLIVKNIECILHAIPWSLRKFNREYFQAIIYTSLLCSGSEITFNDDDNVITLQTPNHEYKFICSFTQELTIKDAPLFKKLNTLAQNYTLIPEEDVESKPKTLILLNINQPIAGKSKIQLMSQGLIIKDLKICTLDGETTDPISDPDSVSNFVITSPQTLKKPVRQKFFRQSPPPSPSQFPEEETIQEDDSY